MSGKIGVVGATGAVGRIFVATLLHYISPENLVLFASHRSAGKSIEISGVCLPVYDVAKTDFAGFSLVFFSAGALVSKQYANKAVEAGAWVIDNSSGFRENMPLIVPEINMSDISSRGIIANPNCVVVPLTLTLNALKSFGLVFTNVVTFQSVSGSGQGGINALSNPGVDEFYNAPIAGNIIPVIDTVTENGFTSEEMKISFETNKVLHTNINVTATTVRVPVLRGHSAAVYLKSARPWDLDEVRYLFSEQESLSYIVDETITPLTHVDSCPGVTVSRLRLDYNDPCGLLFWLVSDNLMKGAALNSIQIAQALDLIGAESYV